MDSVAKEKLKRMFRSFIRKIDSGYCDSLSIDQLEKLIQGFKLIGEVEQSIQEPKKKWKLFGK